MGGVFAAASGARWRTGHGSESYPGCYNLPLPGRRYQHHRHEVQYCLALVRHLADEDPWPAGAPQRPVLKATFGEPARKRPYVVLVPGANNGSAKRWPAPYWAALGRRLAAERGLRIVIAGARSEQPLADEVARGMDCAPTVAAGQTSVDELIQLLVGAELVVAGDTGPLHVAAALGRPVVGIYGPTDPANTGPLGPFTRVLRLDLPCSPCYDLRGPAECKLPDRSVKCMWSLQPDVAFVAACSALAAGARDCG